MQNSKGNVSSGLLHYKDDGTPAKLTFGPKDLLVRLCRKASKYSWAFKKQMACCLSCLSVSAVNVDFKMTAHESAGC